MSTSDKSISIVEIDLDSHRSQLLDFESFKPDWNSKSKIYWVHAYSANPNEDKKLEALAKKLGLEQKFLSSSLMKPGTHIQEKNDSLFLPLEFMDFDIKTHDTKTSEYFIYLTHQYCLTMSKEPIRVLDDLLEKYKATIEFVKTPGFLVFLIMDESINDYSETLLEFDTMIDNFDEKIEHKFNKHLYEEIIHLKREMLRFKHNIYKLRDKVTRLVSRKHSVISEACRSSLHDLLSHYLSMIQGVDSEIDFINSSLDSLKHLLTQQMNETMRLLTVFASIMLPVALVPAIYGMNFELMPELHWKYGYYFALGMMLAVGLGVFIFLKKKKWF